MNQNITSHVLVAILFLIVGLGIGYASFSGNDTYEHVAEMATGSEMAEDSTSSTQAGNASTASPNESTESDGAVAVSADSMTDAQVKLANALGIDPNSVTITDEMVACAEAKVGVARVEEFKNGATPSFSEGVQLAACYTGS